MIDATGPGSPGASPWQPAGGQCPGPWANGSSTAVGPGRLPSRRAAEASARFGERVRQPRGQKGWLQEELADRAGAHRTYVGSIERGERNISLVDIERLAATLGISLAELFLPIEEGSDAGA